TAACKVECLVFLEVLQNECGIVQDGGRIFIGYEEFQDIELLKMLMDLR
ncbi:hypothetical protein Tco_1513820, partial [Tanacetum coccineum]